MYEIEQMLVPAGKGIRALEPEKGSNVLVPRGMVWHYTANRAATADAVGHYRYWQGFDEGAHYVIDDKRIFQCAPDNEIVWHAGPGRDTTRYALMKYPKYPNFETIGVELCVNEGSDWKEVYKRAVYLGAVKCLEYGWTPARNFDRHYDMTGKPCPLMWTPEAFNGQAMWEQFLADVAKMITALTVVIKMGKYFADVDDKNDWFAAEVNQAYERGIVRGEERDSKRYLCVGEPMKSERIAVLINRAVSYVLNEISK